MVLHAKFKRYIETDERQWATVVFSLISPIPMLLTGFTAAFPSSAVLDLTGEATEFPNDFFLSTLLISIFVALGPLGAIFGGPVGGWVADRWGRKCSMMFCGVPYLIGYLLISYAHYTPTATTFKVLLMTGRLTCGVGFGWTAAVVPIYLGEVSSKKLRGVIVGTINETMLTSGIVFSYVLGAISGFRYYYISLVAVGLVALFEVLMIWLPETPRWLLARGQVEQAESVLLWLRGKKINIKEELEEIKHVVVAKRNRKKNLLQELLRWGVLIPFVYVLITLIFLQTSGIGVVTAFAASIFSDAGVANPRVTSIYGVGIVTLVGNISTFFVIDLVGRTTLLILSGTGMFVGCSILGIHFFITRPSLCSTSDVNDSTSLMLDAMNDRTVSEPCNAHFAPLAIASLVLYRFSFAIGLGPVPWILLSEMLPLSVRGFASGLVTTVMWLTAGAVTGLYLEYTALVEQWFAMWTFALSNILAVLFVIFFIPETKGKSLEELERRFTKHSDLVETVL